MTNIKEFLAKGDLTVVSNIARTHGLTKSDALVLAYAANVLYDYRSAQDNGRVAISKARCAKETGLSESTVRRALRKLAAEGVVTLSEIGGMEDGKKMASLYELSDDFEPIKQRAMQNLQIVTKSKMTPVNDPRMTPVNDIENQQDNNLLQGQNDTPVFSRGQNGNELLEAILLELRGLREKVENLETAILKQNDTPISKTISISNLEGGGLTSPVETSPTVQEGTCKPYVTLTGARVNPPSVPNHQKKKNSGGRPRPSTEQTTLNPLITRGTTVFGNDAFKGSLSAPEPQNELSLTTGGKTPPDATHEPQVASCEEGLPPLTDEEKRQLAWIDAVISETKDGRTYIEKVHERAALLNAAELRAALGQQAPPKPYPDVETDVLTISEPSRQGRVTIR